MIVIVQKVKKNIRHLHCMKKRIFVLQKFVKRTEKIFSLVFVCFRFTEISYFLSFPSNENVRKQHLSANAYFCVNMKSLYTIAGRKDEIFCRIGTKTFLRNFLLVFRSTFCWLYLSKKMKYCRITAKTSHFSTFRWRYSYFFDNIL